MTTVAIPRTPPERLRWALTDAWTIASRDLIHRVTQPAMVVSALAFPVVFVLLFAYVFGSAMQIPGGGDYREFLMPGMFAQTMAFGIGNTAAAVAVDVERGVTDRFRSMPIAPSAVVVGRSVADMLGSVLDLAVIVACGLAVGWRWHGGVDGALLAIGLLLLLRFAFLWIGIYIGLLAPNQETVNSLWAALFPFTMVTSAFVAPEQMPSWLGAIADWNPLSATIGATRELFDNPGRASDAWPAEHAELLAVVWPLVLVAIFLPLSVRRYQRLSR